MKTHEGAPVPAKGKNMMAALSYLWILIIIPFLTDAKNDPFVKFHLKQGLTLVIFEVIGMLVGWFPIIGWFVGWIIWLLSLILTVIGIANVWNGREKELPLIGQYGKHFKF
jgi:uncharacterized membrane protein